MAFLKAENLGKSWAEDWVVHDVSFEVQALSQVAIIGATGSGKTSLLKMLGGLLQPDAGNVYLQDQRVPGPNEVLIAGHKKIGYLSQHFELRNNYRVQEVISMATKTEALAAAKILEVCRVTHLQDRWTDELSGGERQRIALARLLVAAPQLLLLDEPFSNLDAAHKKTMQAVLQELGRQTDITFILVSHDPADILSWAEQVLVMQGGKLVQEASPQVIYRQPKNAYVAALTGDYNEIGAGHPLEPAMIEATGKSHYFLRPQAIQLLAAGEGHLQARVLRLLFMGSHYSIHLQMDKEIIIAYSFTQTVTPGSTVSLHIQW